MNDQLSTFADAVRRQFAGAGYSVHRRAIT